LRSAAVAGGLIQTLPGQSHIDILHVIIGINRFQKRFNLFALGIA